MRLLRRQGRQMIIETTPKCITPEINRFCKIIAGKKANNPSYIPVRSDTNCKPRYCFPNVREKVDSSGGKVITGWIIWKRGNMYLYAEAHAIWETPKGELIDITPKEDGEEQIMFLPDDRVEYKGRSIPSKFLPLTKSKRVMDFIRAKERLYLGKENREESEKIVADCQKIFNMDVGEEDPCPCGSKLKFKDCCSPNK